MIPAVDIGYPSSGSSMDWAVAKAGIPYGSTLELRPTVEEGFGFILPPEQILPTAKVSDNIRTVAIMYLMY